jgi:hypothetical protein
VTKKLVLSKNTIKTLGVKTRLRTGSGVNHSIEGSISAGFPLDPDPNPGSITKYTVACGGGQNGGSSTAVVQ